MYQYWKGGATGSILGGLSAVIASVFVSEYSTPSTEAEKSAARSTLYTCLDIGLKLIHPFMPFISEVRVSKSKIRNLSSFFSLKNTSSKNASKTILNLVFRSCISAYQDVLLVRPPL